jgi:predicted aspartyl protease
MNIHISFDPQENLIYLHAKIFGPKGSRIARLALDTGATTTLVSADIIDALGYSPAAGEMVRLIMGGSIQYASQVTVQMLEAADQRVENLAVICHNLPEESGLDGLLGLNFLSHFDTEINYSSGTLIFQSIQNV